MNNFIKDILYKLGFGHVWQNQSTFNINRLKQAVLTQLERKYVSLWKTKKADGTSRLQFYNSVSDNYQLEPYLIHIKHEKHRQALCKLRISAHDLLIEIGRHKNIPKQDRKCKYCDVIEDEIHFLDNCKIFNNIRTELISKIQISFPDVKKPK